MKLSVEACLIGSILLAGAAAQQPALTRGVSVQMPVAAHAVEMRAADGPNAKVVAITAEGKVYLGVQVVEPAGLGNLAEEVVYLKADAGRLTRKCSRFWTPCAANPSLCLRRLPRTRPSRATCRRTA